MMNLNELRDRSHALAVEKGWWEGVPLPKVPAVRVLSSLELIHGELSEASEEVRCGRYEMWYRDDGKPEGFVVELGDAVIRAMDLVGAMGERIADERGINTWNSSLADRTADNVLAHIRHLRAPVCRATYHPDPYLVQVELGLMIGVASGTAEALNLDLAAAIEAKHKFNKGRPYRHGGKLA